MVFHRFKVFIDLWVESFLKTLGFQRGFIKWHKNKQGNWIKPRPPSQWGYIISPREGTWCVKCAYTYGLDKAYLKSEGTPDEWIFITPYMKYLFCGCCRRRIT